MNETHEARIAYLEKMLISQGALFNAVVNLMLQNDGTLRMSVAEGLRLMQINLEKQVHPDFLESILDLRSLLTSQCSDESIAASLQPKIRLVDPLS